MDPKEGKQFSLCVQVGEKAKESTGTQVMTGLVKEVPFSFLHCFWRRFRNGMRNVGLRRLRLFIVVVNTMIIILAHAAAATGATAIGLDKARFSCCHRLEIGGQRVEDDLNVVAHFSFVVWRETHCCCCYVFRERERFQ